MAEIIAAVVGVLLGTLISWLRSRSRPHYLVCEDYFRARIALGGKPWDWSVSWYAGKQGSIALEAGLPQTKVLYKDQPVNVLSVLRLRFRNTGERIIDHPNVMVKLDESTRILGCAIHLEPERPDVGGVENIQSERAIAQRDSNSRIVEPNKVAVTLESLYPHSAAEEVAILDIYCSGEIQNPEVSGQGRFQDGSVWATKFEPWQESRKRVRRRVSLFNLANVLGLLVLCAVYMIWQPPLGLVSIHLSAMAAWASHPLFFVLATWLVLLVGYAFYMAMRGWYLALWLPFLGRDLVVSLRRRRPKKTTL
jgi:hypothetical protein